jgi:hypothetical protein
MTTPLVKRCRADDKGNLVIPLGAAEAGADVEVVIRPVNGTSSSVLDNVSQMTEAEYLHFLQQHIGSSPAFPDADGLVSANHVARRNR